MFGIVFGAVKPDSLVNGSFSLLFKPLEISLKCV